MPYQTATNPNTGEKIVLVDNQWQPYTQSATNAQGAKAFLVGDKWLTDTGAADGVPGPRQTDERSLGGFVSNIGTSAKRMVGDIAHAVTHPIQTVSGALDVGAGALQNILPKALVDFVNKSETPEALAAGQRAVQAANAAGGVYKARYGTPEAIAKTLYEDPVGAASDLSTLLSGGAALAGKAGLGTTQRALATASRVTNPLEVPALAAKAVTSKPVVNAMTALTPQPVLNALQKESPGLMASAASSLAGGLSGKPGEAYRQAFEAGKKGDVAFLENLRGKVPADDLLADIKQGVAKIQTDTSAAYANAKSGWAADKTPLDFTPVDAAFQKVKDSLTVNGKSRIGAAEQKVVDEIGDVLKEWRDDPSARTALDLDALKQRVDAIYPESPKHTQAQRAVTEVRNAVKNAIVQQAPDYAQAMSSYDKQLTLLREIDKALGTGDKVAKETAINKAMSLLKSKPTAEYKRGLAAELEAQGGVNVMPGIAGQELSQWLPSSGVGKTVAGGGLTAAYFMHHPELAAILPFTSPRVMGESFYKLGQGSGMGKRGVNALANMTPQQAAALNALAAQERAKQQNQNAMSR